MAEILARCRCGQRVSGLFRVTKPDGSTHNRLFCASCGLNPRGEIRHDLVRSFSTTHKTSDPKPVAGKSPDYYLVRIEPVDPKPFKPYLPNLESELGHDPNPEWLRK